MTASASIDLAVARAELGQAPAYDGARHRRRGRCIVAGRVDRPGTVSGDLPPELAEQPRVAADRAMAVAAHGHRRLRREPADQLHRAAGASAAGGAARSPRGPSRAGSAGPRPRRDRRRARRRGSAAAGPRCAAPGRTAPPARSGRPTARRRRRGPAAAARRAPSTARARCGPSSTVESPCGAVPSRSSSPAVAAAPSSRCARSEPGRIAQRGLQQRAHDAEGEVALERTRRARRTRHPAAVASSAPCSSSAVLPSPAAASTTTTPPLPAVSRSTAARSTSSSTARSMSGDGADGDPTTCRPDLPEDALITSNSTRVSGEYSRTNFRAIPRLRRRPARRDNRPMLIGTAIETVAATALPRHSAPGTSAAAARRRCPPTIKVK